MKKNTMNTLDLSLLKQTIRKYLSDSSITLYDNDNLLMLGLDSISILKISSFFRQHGIQTTFAQLIEKPYLSYWQTLLPDQSLENPPESISTDNVLKKISGLVNPDSTPFSLTDVQYAYWIGRRNDQTLGNISCHVYIEFDNNNIDVQRLQLAWQWVYLRHSMLHTQFNSDASQQCIIDHSPPTLVINDWRDLAFDEIERQLLFLRQQLSHRLLAIEQAEVAGLTLTLLPEKKSRIHFDIDLLVADVQSFQLVLHDLALAYQNGNLPLDLSDWSFSNYLIQQKAERSKQYAIDRQYWLQQLSTLPKSPELPLKKTPETIKQPIFNRRQFVLDIQQWQELKEQSIINQTTPAMTLLTAYSMTIGKWSSNNQFLINLPLFNRYGNSPILEQVVADFTNLLLLPVEYQANNSFLIHLQQIQTRFYQDIEHTTFSGVQLQRELSKYHDSQMAIAPVVFACNLSTSLIDDTIATHLGKLVYMISQTPQTWIDHQVHLLNNGLLLAWDSIEELFPSGVLDDMFQDYCNLVIKLINHSDWHMVFNYDLPSHQAVIRQQANATTVPYEPNCIHIPFFEHTRLFPHHIALIDSSRNEQISYQQLAVLALQVAALLLQSGIKENESIAVILPRGTTQIVALLGVLAAGGNYVPISPFQPDMRRKHIIQQANIRFILTNNELITSLLNIQDITVLTMEQSLQYQPLSGPVEVSPESKAYIIFTSGSTGIPKGVVITHDAAWNTLVDINRRYQITSNDCILAISAFDFDLSVYDIFGILSVGGKIVTLDEEFRRDAHYWLMLLDRYQITIWNSVPALFEMLLIATEGRLQSLSLRLVLLSGDWINLSLPKRLFYISPDTQLVALGGATEASIWSNVQNISLPLPSEWTSIPYGYPLANQSFRVVKQYNDGFSSDCPDWVCGEIWIGGRGIAKEYCANPQLTQCNFISEGNLRWYRTGDIGRYWPDGTLEFLGRQDHQVKIRGYRIELGEIESILNAQPNIRRSVALVLSDSMLLVAVVEPIVALDIEQLKEQLKGQLPDYMRPQHIIAMSNLPLSDNGKINRKVIKEQINLTQSKVSRPFNAIEYKVAQIWQTLLHIDNLTVNSNFFQCGGDSLLATRVITELKRQGLTTEQPLKKLFAYPVLSDFAIELNPVDIVPQTDISELINDKKHRHQPFALTEVQNAYWLGSAPGMALNCETTYCLILKGKQTNISYFKQAWQKLFNHHEMLRAMINDQGLQQIREKIPDIIYNETILYDADITQAYQYLHLSWENHHWQSQDLPIKFEIVHYRDNHQLIALLINYTLIDAYSVKLLLKEFRQFYKDPQFELPPLELSFRDYLQQIRRETTENIKAQQFWLNRLDTIPSAPSFPLFKDPFQTKKAIFNRRKAVINKLQWQQLKKKVQQYGMTASSLLLTVYASIIGQWSKQKTFTLNLTLFDRKPIHPQINQIVGDFTTLIPVIITLSSTDSLQQRILTIQQEIASILEYRACSSLWIQQALAERHRHISERSFPVVFTSTLGLNDDFVDSFSESEISLSTTGMSETPQTWLDHQVYQYNDQLVLCWDSVDEIFPDKMLDSMFTLYVDTLNQLVTLPWHLPLILPDKAIKHNKEVVNHVTISSDEPPQDELEQKIAAIWQETLGISAISRHDNFFLLGGDSLKATRIVTLLHLRHITSTVLSLRLFFSSATIAELAEQIRQPLHENSTTLEEGVL